MTLWRHWITWTTERDAACGVSRNGAVAALAAPLVVCAVYLALLLLPPTHYSAIRLLDENGPVENLTFLSAFAAVIVALRTARDAARRRLSPLVWGFYLVFALGMLFIAGEEIAWGQQYFSFETPASWKAMNAQGETTIHNLAAIQGKTEFIRLVFGIGGLVGLAAGGLRGFRAIATPAALAVLFAVITAHSLIDAWNDASPVSVRVDFYINKFSEMVEMFIAFAGLGYAWLNGRMIARLPLAGPALENSPGNP
jgi:hypothetical protein